MSFACAGLVLVGGASKRMGTDKARLRLGGRTLLEHAVSALRAAGLGEILIIGASPEGFAGPAVDGVFPDEIVGIGPLGGILTGLKRMRAERGFFVACDMPLLDPHAIAMTVERSAAAGVDVDATVPQIAGRLEPLHAVYAKTCIPAIEKQIAEGDLRAHALAGNVRVHLWDPAEAGLDVRCFTNVNTPEDFDAIERSTP